MTFCCFDLYFENETSSYEFHVIDFFAPKLWSKGEFDMQIYALIHIFI